MTQRKYIVLGDTTTHGGTVITAWGQDGPYPYTIDGIPIACVGDKVTCPKCRGTHTILGPGAIDPPMTVHGRIPALENDDVSDGSKLISCGQFRGTHGNKGDGSHVKAAIAERMAWAEESRMAKAAAAQSAVEAQGSLVEEADEDYVVQYVIIDEKTGMPIKFDYAYCIRVDDGDEFVDKPAKDTAESRLVQRSEKVAVEMLPPIQLQIGV